MKGDEIANTMKEDPRPERKNHSCESININMRSLAMNNGKTFVHRTSTSGSVAHIVEDDKHMLLVGVVTFVSVACVVRLFLSTSPRLVDVRSSIRSKQYLASFIRTLGMVMWPFVLLCVVKREDRSNTILVIPILWHVCMWFVDMHFVLHATHATDSIPASIRIDPMLLGGVALGICNLVGNRPDSKYAYLFMYAMVVCFLFVMPTHTLKSGCIEEQIIDNVQKVILYYCIGFLLSGILLTRLIIDSATVSSEHA